MLFASCDLRDVYIMDHVVDPRPCKICDLLLNLSWDHFNLHQGKKVRVTMEFEVPKRHVLRPTLSTDMIQRVLRWERQKSCFDRKKQGLMAHNCCYIFFWGGEEEKMKTRGWSNFIFHFLFQNYHFWPYI